MDKMDWGLCPWLRALGHAQRRGIDWFQQPWSFCLELKMCFGPSPTRAHGWMKQPDVLQFLMNSKDRELPSCLWVLPNVNRRHIDWFQHPPWSFHLGLAMCFGPFAWRIVAWLDEMPDVLQFHINKMEGELPSWLQALWHVYRRGRD